MTRHAITIGATLMLLCSLSGPLYGWGSATHSYIVHEAGAKQGPASLQETYGAILPDVFNLAFGDPHQGHLATLTHSEFTKVVQAAASDTEKSLAYGFASHNEAWGADQTAHIGSVNDPDSGYVIRKSDALVAALRPQVRLFLLLNNVPASDAVLDETLPGVAHTAVETAIDLLVCQKEDPDASQRLVMAARTQGWAAPALLCKAYVGDLVAEAGITEAVAAPLIIAAETDFRTQITSYGTALSQANAVDALAEQGVELAKRLLAAQQGIIVDIPADLMKQILNTAIDAVKDDYGLELAATVAQVRGELESHGI
ncbi:MAG: hypothetical protein ACM3VT_12170 [Solirubrobacterales bacterium]